MAKEVTFADDELFPAQTWRPVGGCYGRVHLARFSTGRTLCGMRTVDMFTAWTTFPAATCKRCIKLASKEAKRG